MAHEQHHGHDHGTTAPKVTAIDPVCEMVVDTATARSAEVRGKTYYFCSEGCRTKFVADPDKYLNKVPFVLPPKKGAVAATSHEHHRHGTAPHPAAAQPPSPASGRGILSPRK
jgi:YHS domain-containing protein